MAEKLIAVPESNLTDIADAIRLKRDIATSIPVDDMAMQIGLIEGEVIGRDLVSERTVYFDGINSDTVPLYYSVETGLRALPYDYANIIIKNTYDGISDTLHCKEALFFFPYSIRKNYSKTPLFSIYKLSDGRLAVRNASYDGGYFSRFWNGTTIRNTFKQVTEGDEVIPCLEGNYTQTVFAINLL